MVHVDLTGIFSPPSLSSTDAILRLSVREEHEQLLSEWKIRIIREKLFEPEIVYGYFKCHNKDRQLLVENPDGNDVTLEFPRSTKPEHLCLSDYFGNDDVVVFQSVLCTVSNRLRIDGQKEQIGFCRGWQYGQGTD